MRFLIIDTRLTRDYAFMRVIHDSKGHVHVAIKYLAFSKSTQFLSGMERRHQSKLATPLGDVSKPGNRSEPQ